MFTSFIIQLYLDLFDSCVCLFLILLTWQKQSGQLTNFHCIMLLVLVLLCIIFFSSSYSIHCGKRQWNVYVCVLMYTLENWNTNIIHINCDAVCICLEILNMKGAGIHMTFFISSSFFSVLFRFYLPWLIPKLYINFVCCLDHFWQIWENVFFHLSQSAADFSVQLFLFRLFDVSRYSYT